MIQLEELGIHKTFSILRTKNIIFCVFKINISFSSINRLVFVHLRFVLFFFVVHKCDDREKKENTIFLYSLYIFRFSILP